MKFSLVLPFYNSKEYFPACIESILAQTYLKRHASDVEIILVNNNSTDGTDLLASQYAHQSVKKYNHLVKILHCPTWGASAARNLGLRSARGEFVWFIDSDDWIEPDALDRLSNMLKEKPQADIITFGAVKDYAPGAQQRGKTELPPVGKGQKDWEKRFIMYGFGAWQYIARREWLLHYDLFFDEGIIHEDMALISSFPLYTKEIYPLKQNLYHYIQHDNSVLHRSEWNPHALDIFSALDKIYLRFEQMNLPHIEALEYFFIWNLLIDTARELKAFPEGRANYRRIRATLKHYFPHWRKNRYLRKKSFRFQLKLRLKYWFSWF